MFVTIAVVFGTRPEIIKMSPLIRKLEGDTIPYYLLHTGQHYSYEMDRVFFEELHLPQAGYHLDVGSGNHGEQTARILTGVEEILLQDRPDMVLVQGDTNTVMAGALAAAKLHIPVGHVEAGLRSFDRSMPEEINRIVADHVSDLLFAPTAIASSNLRHEGIDRKRISVTGNTIVDAVYQNQALADKYESILQHFGLQKGEYFLVTTHRAENVDDRDRLGGILRGLSLIHTTYDLPVLFPIHPRTQKMIHTFGIVPEGITITPPLGYLEFLYLEKHARCILTDSGGVQEESCILQVPCVTLRDNTERPETVEVGANILAGTRPEAIVHGVRDMMERRRDWKNPFGDGKASGRITGICKKAINYL
jgi:UDP-N-acetylglucosamine 2-epimerase (non-hydrolysing)